MRLSRRLAVLAIVLAAPAAFAQPGTTGAPLPPGPQPEDSTMPPPPDPNVAADPMQPAPPPPPPTTGTDVAPATTSPGSILPNMLPTRVGATVDFRGDFSHAAEGSGFAFGETLLSFDLYGSYIWPQGYGAYIQLPYYYASGGDEESQQGVGNIELGGLYKVPTGRSEVLLRGGIALDSAGQIDSLLSAFAHISPRMYDAYTMGLLSNWFRAEASLRHSEGNLRLAASLGADVPVGGDDEFDLEIDMLAKAAVSVGFENPSGSGLGLGFVVMQAVGADGGDDDDNTIFALNATVSFPVSPTMSMYGAFGLPDLENNIDEFDLFAIGVGVRAAIN